MASIPMLEMEDQTDEDFFDKLVDDDVDEVGVSGIKGAELSGGPFADGDGSKEANTFSKLSYIDGYDNLDVKKENGGNAYGQDSAVGGRYESFGHVDHSLVSSNSFAFDEDLVVPNEANIVEKLSVNGVNCQYDDSESKRETDGDAEGWIWDGKIEDLLGEEVNASAAIPDSFSFNNGITPNEGIEESELKSDSTRSKSGESAHSAVKEVMWSSFSESAAHGVNGFGSYSDFFTGLAEGSADNLDSEPKITPDSGPSNVPTSENSYNFLEYQGNHGSAEQSTDPRYLENLYPGWKYDPYSGQWYQVDSYDGTVNGQQNIEATSGSVTGSFDSSADRYWGISDGKSSQTFAQQTAQSISQTINHVEAAPNQVSQVNSEYPASMIFDPQYPGWYYDTIALEWRTLEAYQSTVQSSVQSNHLQPQNGSASTANHSLGYGHSMYNYASLDLNEQNLAAPLSNCSHQGSSIKQPDTSHVNHAVADSGGDEAWENAYGSNVHSNSHVSQKNFNNIETQTSYGKSTQGYDSSMFVSRPNNLISNGSYIQQFDLPGKVETNGPLEYSNEYYGNQRAGSFTQQFVPNGHQFVPHVERSSAGRPPHALVTFGFGGKLIVMKDGNSLLGSKV
ncbi:hypothetical protein Dimus_034896 [Dionaea muscipula]